MGVRVSVHISTVGTFSMDLKKHDCLYLYPFFQSTLSDNGTGMTKLYTALLHTEECRSSSFSLLQTEIIYLYN